MVKTGMDLEFYFVPAACNVAWWKVLEESGGKVGCTTFLLLLWTLKYTTKLFSWREIPRTWCIHMCVSVHLHGSGECTWMLLLWLGRTNCSSEALVTLPVQTCKFSTFLCLSPVQSLLTPQSSVSMNDAVPSFGTKDLWWQESCCALCLQRGQSPQREVLFPAYLPSLCQQMYWQVCPF